ncbi:pep-cterm sorting domain-containing protein [Anaeramoeba ignava]|uniref:Pep-cterm sorting domain-containing protein n=1 Tax=Anaeramoeba ignava TaxID=1746090 RepID=A0A9Q0LWT1_ANAIG|nr:pep-cterm sorting domain-containing protein [Anaeramoeba ignava]
MFPSSILFPILNYFYSGKIEINLENAIQILIFSSKYLIDDLIEFCSHFIKKNFKFDTIVDILKLSDSMNINQLLNYSYKFISKNFDKFIKTSLILELEENHLNSILSNHDIQINEFKLFQSIIKWGKHKLNINQKKSIQKLEKEEKEKLQDQISNIIQKIRFIDFSKQELKDTLKQELIPNQISQQLIQFQKIQNENEKDEDEKELKKFIEKKEKENSNLFIFKPRFRFESTITQKKEHIKKLKKWINDDEFFYKMKLRYSAKRDGFDCKKWHSKCDNKGKTLIIIKATSDNYRNSNNGSIIDPNAFIFSLRNDITKRKPKKFPIKKRQEKYAIYYDPKNGPSFGDDIYFKYGLSSGDSNFGISYKLPDGIQSETDESYGYFIRYYDEDTGMNDWNTEEIETYFI